MRRAPGKPQKSGKQEQREKAIAQILAEMQAAHTAEQEQIPEFVVQRILDTRRGQAEVRQLSQFEFAATDHPDGCPTALLSQEHIIMLQAKVDNLQAEVDNLGEEVGKRSICAAIARLRLAIAGLDATPGNTTPPEDQTPLTTAIEKVQLSPETCAREEKKEKIEDKLKRANKIKMAISFAKTSLSASKVAVDALLTQISQILKIVNSLTHTLVILDTAINFSEAVHAIYRTYANQPKTPSAPILMRVEFPMQDRTTISFGHYQIPHDSQLANLLGYVIKIRTDSTIDSDMLESITNVMAQELMRGIKSKQYKLSDLTKTKETMNAVQTENREQLRKNKIAYYGIATAQSLLAISTPVAYCINFFRSLSTDQSEQHYNTTAVATYNTTATLEATATSAAAYWTTISVLVGFGLFSAQCATLLCNTKQLRLRHQSQEIEKRHGIDQYTLTSATKFTRETLADYFGDNAPDCTTGDAHTPETAATDHLKDPDVATASTSFFSVTTATRYSNSDITAPLMRSATTSV